MMGCDRRRDGALSTDGSYRTASRWVSVNWQPDFHPTATHRLVAHAERVAITVQHRETLARVGEADAKAVHRRSRGEKPSAGGDEPVESLAVVVDDEFECVANASRHHMNALVGVARGGPARMPEARPDDTAAESSPAAEHRPQVDPARDPNAKPRVDKRA